MVDSVVGAGRFERPTPCAQGRCATRLRYAPTCEDLFILNHFLIGHPFEIPLLASKRIKTVSKPSHCPLTVSKPVASFACRLIFSKASRFICNFIREYFLKTFASPCRSI